jgi:hypothetical protein
MRIILIAAMLLITVQAQAIETYWTLPAGSCQGHECQVPMTDDLLIMDAFRNSLVLYQDADKVIIIACMEQNSIDAFLAETDGAPLTADTAEAMHLGSYYLGKSFADVFARYPELAGTYSVLNEDGSESTFPIVQDKHFGGCE